MSGLAIILLLGALLVWLVVPRKPRADDPTDPAEPIDLEALEAAEREVRELGTSLRPEDGFEGDDWGPGAGKHRGGRD